MDWVEKSEDLMQDKEAFKQYLHYRFEMSEHKNFVHTLSLKLYEMFLKGRLTAGMSAKYLEWHRENNPEYWGND
jgi:hypothetical protein